MTTMPTFGLFSLMQQRHAARGNRSVFADLDDQVALAEDLGFETAWFAEHHFSGYSLCPSPLMAAAYFAGRTKNIRLGTGVIVLPLYDPIRVMEEIAMVDLMSDGRLIVGVGGGYQPFEFERFRLNLEDSAAMFMESLDIIEAGLTQEEFSYDGQHYKIPPTRIAAKPVQKPLPRIAVAGMLAHDAIKRRVARHGWYLAHQTKHDPVYAGGKVANVLIDLRNAARVAPLTARQVQEALNAFLDAAHIDQHEDDMGCLLWVSTEAGAEDQSVSAEGDE